jgi:hypothetical protein
VVREGLGEVAELDLRPGANGMRLPAETLRSIREEAGESPVGGYETTQLLRLSHWNECQRLTARLPTVSTIMIC